MYIIIEDEVLNLVIEYDVNGDGTIDFDEFMEMMKKQAEHQEIYSFVAPYSFFECLFPNMYKSLKVVKLRKSATLVS